MKNIKPVAVNVLNMLKDLQEKTSSEKKRDTYIKKETNRIIELKVIIWNKNLTGWN